MTATNHSDRTCLPRVGVGAVVFHNGRVLLVRRARPPRAGEWAIPGGKVRAGETLQAAAEREIHEETGVRIRAGEPVHAFDLIERNADGTLRWHYVIVDLMGEYLDGEPRAASDAGDAGWFDADALRELPLNPETRRLLATWYPELASAS